MTNCDLDITCQLIKATNHTTTYTYYWCQTHRCVIKDVSKDGIVRGVSVATRVIG